MLTDKPFFTKTFTRILATVKRMASPNGTTIAELAQCLSITRRSVFRLIRIMERNYHIPVIMNRDTFGGQATYRLPQSFIDGLSKAKTPPITFSFDEATVMYLIAHSGVLPTLKAIFKSDGN